jgi:hypothetical protein
MKKGLFATSIVLAFAITAFAIPAFAQFKMNFQEGGMQYMMKAHQMGQKMQQKEALSFEEMQKRMISNMELSTLHMNQMLEQLKSGELEKNLNSKAKNIKDAAGKTKAAKNIEELRKIQQEMHEKMKTEMEGKNLGQFMRNNPGHFGKMMKNRMQTLNSKTTENPTQS